MFHADCNPQQQELPGCSHNNVLTEPQPLSAAVTTAVSCQASPRPRLLQQQPLWWADLLSTGCHTVSKSQHRQHSMGLWKETSFLYLLDFPLSNCQSPLLSVCERMFAVSCQQSSHGTVVTCNMLLSASVSAAGRYCPNCAVCSSGTSLHCKLSFILTPLVICNNNDEHDINAVMHVPSG